MRLGFFGGSFDPPHRGHLAVARAAMEAFGLGRVLLAPTGLQPLKRKGAETPFRDRLNMVELLCSADPGLEPSTIDGPQENDAPNYTVDTLARLRASLSASAPHMEVFAIVGADSFLTMRQWRRPEDLLLLAQWIVVSRPGFDLHALSPLGLTEGQRARVHLLEGVAEPISATAVRACLHAGEDCSELVTAPVLAYIRAQHLYGT